LTKLLNNTLRYPDIGALPDGIVIADFVPAFIPSKYRPKICELGDLNQNSLLAILLNYQKWRRYSGFKHPKSTEFLASMIEDLGPYPYVISHTLKYSWDSPHLRHKIDEITKNTAKKVAEKLWKKDRLCFPYYGGYHFMISERGQMSLAVISEPRNETLVRLSSPLPDKQDIGDKKIYTRLQEVQELEDRVFGAFSRDTHGLDRDLFWRTLMEELKIPFNSKLGSSAYQQFLQYLASSEGKET